MGLQHLGIQMKVIGRFDLGLAKGLVSLSFSIPSKPAAWQHILSSFLLPASSHPSHPICSYGMGLHHLSIFTTSQLLDAFQNLQQMIHVAVSQVCLLDAYANQCWAKEEHSTSAAKIRPFGRSFPPCNCAQAQALSISTRWRPGHWFAFVELQIVMQHHWQLTFCAAFIRWVAFDTVFAFLISHLAIAVSDHQSFASLLWIDCY